AADYLRLFVARRLRPAEVVEEVVQDSLVSIHRARHTYNPAKPVVPWMLAISRCRVHDYLRRWMTERRFEISDVDYDKQGAATHQSEAMTGLMFDEALAQLPERQRLILQLLKHEGLSIREVSEQLQMSEAAVRVAAHRAYEGLKNYFLAAVYENA